MIRFGKEKVLLLHRILIEQTGGEDGVRDMGLLESALAACDATFDGKELFPTKEEKAARLCTGLVSNHAFVDGNKRIGVYVMLTFLEVNGIRLNVTDEELVGIGLSLAQSKMKYEELLARFRVGEVKYSALSRGMKMKLLLAAALSHEPKLLLLDEATSGLDPVARQDILDMLMEFTRDEAHSVLFSSHIADDLEKVCDYVTFLHGGKVLLSEEKDALLERYGVLNCSQEEFSAIPREAIVSFRRSPYGVTAVVRQEALPIGVQVQRVGLEELFRALVQEEEHV